MNCKVETGLELVTALDIRQGERVALVGGGDKAKLAGQLAAAARQLGWTALWTTATELLSPAPSAGLLNNSHPDLVLVEVQVPDDCQPVMPPATTLVLVVAGLSAGGRPLDDTVVHRPAKVANRDAVPRGTRVAPVLAAAVLSHPQGRPKGYPPGARVVAVLDEATPQRVPAGREIARRLLDTGHFERILLADLDASPVAGEAWQGNVADGFQVGPESGPRVAAVVLAAGRSQRLGQNKLLLPLGGRPLIAHAVTVALGSQAADVWVVVGAAAEEVRAALAGQPVWFLANPGWPEGQAAAVRTAVTEARARSAGVLFLAGDMPFVTPTHLDRLLARWRPGVAVVWSGYDGRRGIPALFGSETYAALLQLRGDVGGRALAGQYVEEVVPADFPPLDVDSAEGYAQVRRWLEMHAARE